MLVRRGDQFLDHTFHHIGRPDFAWVLPSQDDDHFLLLLFGFPGDGDFRDIVAADRSADRFDAELQSFQRVLLCKELGLLEKANHLAIAIGQRHAYEDIIIFVIKSKVEREAIEFGVGQLLYINWGLLIDYVFRPPAPPLTLGLGLMQRKDSRLAPVLEEGVFLFLE